MATETERKYLVHHPAWQALEKPPGVVYRQGYICNSAERTVRVRLAGTQGYLTIKGPTTGATRTEFEYTVPAQDAAQMLDLYCSECIEKTRYHLPLGKHTWEVDVFHGANEGLIVAEIELRDEQEVFDLPDWVSTEVTGEEKYYNACLALHPYRDWEGH